MRRTIEIKPGKYDRLFVPPEHRDRKEEGATAESLCGVTIEPVVPTWRDWWAILRGRYEPRVRVREVMTLAAYDFILRETYTTESLEEVLYAESPFIDHLVSGRGAASEEDEVE